MNATQPASQPILTSEFELPPATRKITRRFLFCMLILLPIPFGAVHEKINLPYSIALGLLTVFLIFKAPRSVAAVASGAFGKMSRMVICCLSLTIIYALIQYYAFGFTTSTHPILGSISRRVDGGIFLTSIREMVNFLCIFLATRLYLGDSPRAASALTRVIILAGTLVSFIGLGHWFYDNGNLFWVFEPETITVSNRARWPFVNPNHLGDYMAACALITLGSVLGLFRRLFDHELNRGRRRNRTLAALIGSEDFHFKVLKPVILSVPLLTMVLALLASQSRGGWVGAAIGLICFALLSTSRSQEVAEQESPQVVSLEQHKRSRRYRSGRSRGALRMDGSWAMIAVQNVERFAKPLCIVGASLVVMFFLNSRGRDLVAGRLEFGLLYSMEDIRWTFYRNSWNMFLEHPLFGVGLGGWAENYSRFTSPTLSGLNPVYLHSDPYQLLLELGIIGVLPIITLAISTVVLTIVALRHSTQASQRLPIISLMSAVIALAVSTLPEFPLRIPAISLSLAVWLALLAARCEQRPPDAREPAENAA